jgi:hypothetical protein
MAQPTVSPSNAWSHVNLREENCSYKLALQRISTASESAYDVDHLHAATRSSELCGAIDDRSSRSNSMQRASIRGARRAALRL